VHLWSPVVQRPPGRCGGFVRFRSTDGLPATGYQL
jgi:hypothetical protein